MTFESAAEQIERIGRRLYERGWVLGTSGNFSAVLSRRPLRLAITASSVHKGALSPDSILEIDGKGRVTRGALRPSAETLLHLEIVGGRDAGAVLHTHSVGSTLLSERHEKQGKLEIEGYEMLKGLEGVKTHEHRERIPILPNDQDMPRLAAKVRSTLKKSKSIHAFLLAGHGMYTWGRTLEEAERHVEIVEFLLEVRARSSR
jgi:methylthioribulose-1-phosphate dehydratase